MILSIAQRQVEPDIAVLELSGRIVQGSDSMKVEWTVADLLKESRKKLIMDLSGVTVVDSTGIGILVMCFAKVKKAGGSLRFAGARGMVEETLKITTLDRLIELYPTLSEATRGF